MLTVAIGFATALIYGAADFLGGLAAKRMSAILVTAIAALSGLVVALAFLPLLRGEWSSQAVLLGALSGVAGAVAIGLLYACLAIGPMSILSPLTAVVSAIVPLGVGVIAGERFGLIGYIALALALVAVILVGFVPERGAVRPSLKGVLMAIGSGVSIGALLIILDATPHDSGILPLVFNRAAIATIMFTGAGLLAWVALRRRRGIPDPNRGAWRAGLRFAIACGALDVVANAGLLFGVRIGELSVIAVLTALYPAGTIILAAIVLKERIAMVQYAGLVLAIGAGAMLALA